MTNQDFDDLAFMVRRLQEMSNDTSSESSQQRLRTAIQAVEHVYRIEAYKNRVKAGQNNVKTS